MKTKNKTIREIHKIVMDLIFTGSKETNAPLYVTGYAKHGRKSKFVIWSLCNDKAIATIDYSIRKRVKNDAL